MKLSHLVRSALYRITRNWVPRIIGNDDGPYLSRYYIFGRPRMPDGSDPFDDGGNPKPDVIWPTTLPFGMYLHRFHVGDRDRDLHNHPWTLSLSFVLAGGYIEERIERVGVLDEVIKKRIVKPFRLNVLRSTDFHRVDLIEQDAWSLFVTFKRFQSWGFRERETGIFIPWRDYLARDAVNQRRFREQVANDEIKGPVLHQGNTCNLSEQTQLRFDEDRVRRTGMNYGMSEQLADALGDDEKQPFPKPPDWS